MSWLWIWMGVCALAQAPPTAEAPIPESTTQAPDSDATNTATEPMDSPADTDGQPSPSVESSSDDSKIWLDGRYKLSAAVETPWGFRTSYLTWNGGKYALRGNRSVNARRFAVITGQVDMAKQIRRRTIPGQVAGWSLFVLAIPPAMVGGGFLTASFIFLLGETFSCAAGNDNACRYPYTARFALIGAAGLGTSLVLAGSGMAIIYSLIRPKLVLLNWYTEDEIREGIERYNRALAEEYGVDLSAASSRRTGGELVLEPSLSGAQLRLTF